MFENLVNAIRKGVKKISSSEESLAEDNSGKIRSPADIVNNKTLKQLREEEHKHKSGTGKSARIGHLSEKKQKGKIKKGRNIIKGRKKMANKSVKKKKSRNVSQSALSEAISDLDVEMSRLARKRVELHGSIDNISDDVKDSRKLEEELQKKIAELAEKEAGLNKRRKELQGQLDRVSDKLGKITKIKSEMEDV